MKHFFYALLLLSLFACSSRSAEEVIADINTAVEAQDFGAQIEHYNYFYENFKEHDKFPVTVFMLGYIYNDHFHDLPKAKMYFEEFLQKFPEHDMAESAQIELKFLGVPTEDRFKDAFLLDLETDSIPTQPVL
jgi:tetratricopeptide (TPR) repeat protein